MKFCGQMKAKKKKKEKITMQEFTKYNKKKQDENKTRTNMEEDKLKRG